MSALKSKLKTLERKLAADDPSPDFLFAEVFLDDSYRFQGIICPTLDDLVLTIASHCLEKKINPKEFEFVYIRSFADPANTGCKYFTS